jgi:hypothetical protein
MSKVFAALFCFASGSALAQGYPSPTFLNLTVDGTLTIPAFATQGTVCNSALGVLSTTNATNCPGVIGGSGAEMQISFQPDLVTSVNTTKTAFAKFVKASTVDNIEAAAQQFICSVNPTITFYECGTSTTCATPTTIGTATVTAAGTVVDGSVSSALISAGHYIAWALTAGTCTGLDISATAQIHAN